MLSTKLKSFRIVTVGTGAVGAVYSWRLSTAGAHVTTVCRSNYASVQQDGFSIKSGKWGDAVYRPERVVKTTEEAAAFERNGYDYVVVAMKALPDVYDVSEIVRPVVNVGKSCIVLIQNGLGIEAPIIKAYPSNPLLSIAAYIGAAQTSSGHIIMGGSEQIKLSSYPPTNPPPPELKTFTNLLHEGSVNVDVVEDIVRERWIKTVWNGSFSTLCGLTRSHTQDILSSEELKATLLALMHEIINVAITAGYPLSADDIIADILNKTQNIAMGHKPSMLIDLEMGRPMEIEVILGEVVRTANALKVECPRMSMAYAMLKAINRRLIEQK